jgi:hypothetical protein
VKGERRPAATKQQWPETLRPSPRKRCQKRRLSVVPLQESKGRYLVSSHHKETKDPCVRMSARSVRRGATVPRWRTPAAVRQCLLPMAAA